jgi:hypothetical protein
MEMIAMANYFKNIFVFPKIQDVMKPSTLFCPLQDTVGQLVSVNTRHHEAKTPHVDKLPLISIETGQEAIMFPYCGTEQHRDDFQVTSIPQEAPLHLTDMTSRCALPTNLSMNCSVHPVLSPTGPDGSSTVEPAWQYCASLDDIPLPLPSTGPDVSSTVEPACIYCAGLDAAPLPLPPENIHYACSMYHAGKRQCVVHSATSPTVIDETVAQRLCSDSCLPMPDNHDSSSFTDTHCVSLTPIYSDPDANEAARVILKSDGRELAHTLKCVTTYLLYSSPDVVTASPANGVIIMGEDNHSIAIEAAAASVCSTSVRMDHAHHDMDIIKYSTLVRDQQDANLNQSNMAGVTGLQHSKETKNYESLYSETVPARISTMHKSTIIGSCLKIATIYSETRCALLNNLQSHCVLIVSQSDNDTPRSNIKCESPAIPVTILEQSVTALNAKPRMTLKQELRSHYVFSLLSWKMCLCQAEQDCNITKPTQVAPTITIVTLEQILRRPCNHFLLPNKMYCCQSEQHCTLGQLRQVVLNEKSYSAELFNIQPSNELAIQVQSYDPEPGSANLYFNSTGCLNSCHSDSVCDFTPGAVTLTVSVTLHQCDKSKNASANIILYEKKGVSKSHIILQEIVKNTPTHIMAFFLSYTLAHLYFKLRALVTYTMVYDHLYKTEEEPLYYQHKSAMFKQLHYSSHLMVNSHGDIHQSIVCSSNTNQLYSFPSHPMVNNQGDEHDTTACSSDVSQLFFLLSALTASVPDEDGPDSRSDASQLHPLHSPTVVSIHSGEPDSSIICSKVTTPHIMQLLAFPNILCPESMWLSNKKKTLC